MIELNAYCLNGLFRMNPHSLKHMVEAVEKFGVLNTLSA